MAVGVVIWCGTNDTFARGRWLIRSAMYARSRMSRRLLVVVVAGCYSSPPSAPAPIAARAPESPVVRRPLAAGVGETCARDAGGNVWCWGDLGNSTHHTHARPVQISGLPAVEGVAVATSGSCAWTRTGEVWCWADEPGDDGPVHVPPTRLVGLTGVAEVAVGDSYACARRRSGTIVCWNDVVRPTHITRIQDVHADELVLSDVACARAGHDVTCWKPGERPEVRPRLHGAISIAIDDATVFALLADHRVVSERLLADKEGPTAVAPHDAHAIAAGTERICALGHTVACWSIRDPSGTFVEVPALAGATDVTVGNSHACARIASGHAACWGDAEYLGDGRTYEVSPVTVVGVRDAVQVVVAHEATCVRRATGGVACWGRQLGAVGRDVIAGYHNVPVDIPGIRDAIDLAVAWHGACVRQRGGDVTCWTDTVAGPPVIDKVAAFAGATRLLLEPASRCALVGKGVTCGFGALSAVLPSGVREVWLGFERVCARYPDNRVRCTHANDPAVTLEADVASVGFGLMDTCQVSTAGAVACRRALGDPPSPVSGLPAPAIAVTGAQLDVCALLRDGRVACWDEPEENTGPREAKLLPGISDAVEIAGDTFNGCVRHANGTVSCWGVHTFVGDGKGGDITTPVVLPLAL